MNRDAAPLDVQAPVGKSFPFIFILLNQRVCLAHAQHTIVGSIMSLREVSGLGSTTPRNINGGADTVTITLSANSSYLEVYLMEYASPNLTDASTAKRVRSATPVRSPAAMSPLHWLTT